MARKTDLAVVGKSQPRLDGFAKLSGRSDFTDDVHPAGHAAGADRAQPVAHGRGSSTSTPPQPSACRA